MDWCKISLLPNILHTSRPYREVEKDPRVVGRVVGQVLREVNGLLDTVQQKEVTIKLLYPLQV